MHNLVKSKLPLLKQWAAGFRSRGSIGSRVPDEGENFFLSSRRDIAVSPFPWLQRDISYLCIISTLPATKPQSRWRWSTIQLKGSCSMDVFVTQCAEMIFLRHFTPVCLLLVEIKILLDGSKVNLIAVKYRNTDRELPLCLKTQLCRLVTLSMKPSPSFLRSPGDSWLVKIKPAKFAATDPRWWIVDELRGCGANRTIWPSYLLFRAQLTVTEYFI